MYFKKSALASAITVAFAGQAAAMAYIPQTVTEDLNQVAENIIDLQSGINVALNLGLDGVGSTQIASQQLNTVGWGQTGGSATSALDISAADVQIEQILGEDILVGQSIVNELTGFVDSNRVGSVEIHGLSQIGANAANAAAVNMGDGANVAIFVQDAYFDSYGEDELDQSVRNAIEGIVAQTGSVIVDGGYLGADGTTVSSVQFGTNTVNSAQANATGTLGVKLDQAATDVNSMIDNFVNARANNEYGGDPAVSNIDQIATTTVNALSMTSGEAMTLSPIVAFDRVPEASFSSEPAQLYTDEGDNFRLTNTMYAINGRLFDISDTDWGFDDVRGHQGDASIDSVGQTLLININSVGVNGPTTTETVDGVDVTTTAAAGPLTIGVIDPAGDLQTFEQRLDNGLNVQPGWTQLRLNGNGDESLQFEEGSGNLLFAATGVGAASVSDFSQVQSVSANTFSTSGDLHGASLGSVDYEYGFSDMVLGEWPADLVQMVESDVTIAEVNIAAAYTDDNGPASIDGSQTAALTLNSLSASGDASGYFAQTLDSSGEIVSHLRNRMDAVADERGGAYAGDRMIGGELVSAPIAQTAVSSLNSMSFGSLSDSVAVQLVDRNLLQEGLNALNVGSENGIAAVAQASNVTQAVINRVNTIAAINP